MKFGKQFLTVLAILFTLGVYGQPGGGGPPGGDPPVPITGIEYLLISGGLFGAYKLLKQKFTRNNP